MARAIEQLKQAMEVCELGALTLPDQIDALMDAARAILQEVSTLTYPNETPPCYQPDGDGCAYQCYDGQDEPIEKCKACPLCCSDKQRHYTPPNELTCEGCISLGTSYGPCMNCTRSKLRGDMYRRPPEGEEEEKHVIEITENL